jgi:diguanylate cyclase (GGDEF)-like protein
MALHVPTLAVVAVFVTAILGGLLLFAWRRDQNSDALVWWGSGYLVGSCGFALLAARGAIPDVLSIHIANSIVLVSYTLMLAGARAFGGRETPPTAFLIAPLIWLTALQVPAIVSDINLRAIVMTLCQVVIMWMMAYEFWRGRAERLVSRWPILLVLFTHTLCLVLRIPATIINPASSHADFFRSPIFAVMVFGTVMYTMTIAFLLLSLIKERGELRHKTAALVDSLTGLANRRAFLSDADALAQRRAKSSEPLSVLLADLDRFKAINDAFGHAVGDRVLQLFADTLCRILRADDVSGRLGGEEFAILLPRAGTADAALVAERIRISFAKAAKSVGAHAVGATVSIGVASTSVPMAQVADLLAVADRALYRAKAEGRDRVVAIDCDAAGEAAPSIVPGTPAFAFVPRPLNAA